MATGYKTFADAKGRRGRVGSRVFVYENGSAIDGIFTVKDVGKHGTNGTYVVLDPTPKRNVFGGVWATDTVLAQ